MHATQPQGAASPEPHHAAPANQLVGLFTDDSRFRTWIAQALATAAQPPAPPEQPEQPDLKAMSQEEFYRWSQGASPTGAPHSPCPDDGYTITEPGRKGTGGGHHG